jgi:hypothetical protein
VFVQFVIVGCLMVVMSVSVMVSSRLVVMLARRMLRW